MEVEVHLVRYDNRVGGRLFLFGCDEFSVDGVLSGAVSGPMSIARETDDCCGGVGVSGNSTSTAMAGELAFRFEKGSCTAALLWEV